MIAYTVTKLNLTAEQRPLWNKLNAIIEATTEKQQQQCGAMKTQAGGPTILDRVGWLEQNLAARVQSLHEARPALEQLYQALTPEQKAIIDHPFARD
jgi:Spy/CpxP family protein refolding chaperone